MKTIRTDEFLSEAVWNKMVSDRTNNPRFFQGNVTKDADKIDLRNESCGPLNKYARKIHSQNGEEGIIERIFERILCTNRVAVEFGARDGQSLSNTLHFRESLGFSRVLIEGRNIRSVTGETIVRAIVTHENINDLLADHQSCDLVSIDIDGDDYWVWRVMSIRSRVVIVEFHCAIPNDIPLAVMPGKGDVNSHLPRDGVLNGYYGANLLAFHRLAKTKGYEFCTTIADNAIFVSKEEFSKIGIPVVSEEECIERYFCPIPYWWTFRDKRNREWIIVE